MTIVGVLAAAVLVVIYLKLRQRDLLGALIEKRRATSRVISRADFIEGAEKLPVALSVSSDTLYYENPELEASFELQRIDEVEYDDELTTGREVPASARVLRLRCHGSTFEFLLDKAEQPKWAAALPPRMLGNPPSAHAV